MPSTAKYLYVARMDVDPNQEDLFNEVYDSEHIPELLKVPGVLGVTRYETCMFPTAHPGTSDEAVPKYLIIYEVDNPDVPTSPAFRAAANRGRWAPEVRPHTSNRSRVVYKQV